MNGISGALTARPSRPPATSMARLAIRTLRNTELTVTWPRQNRGICRTSPRLDLTFSLRARLRALSQTPAGWLCSMVDGHPDPPQRTWYAPLPAGRGACGGRGGPARVVLD